MDEKLRESLAAMIDFLTESMVAGAEFAGEQIPLFIQEIIRWGIAEQALWFGVWSVVGLTFLHAGRKFRASVSHRETFEDTRGQDEEMAWFLGFFLPWGGGSIWFLCGATNLFQLTKILVAPRLYLLEVVSSFLK